MVEWAAVAAVGSLLGGLAAVGGLLLRRRRASSDSVKNQRIGGSNVAINSLVINAASSQPAERSVAAPPPPSAHSPGRALQPPPGPVDEPEPICDSGPYEAGPGDWTTIDLDARPGDVVEGTLLADGDFDYYIFNKRNLVAFLNGDDFSAEREDGDEQAYDVAWRPRGNGPWYLVLGAPRRQYVRDVIVDLRRL